MEPLYRFDTIAEYNALNHHETLHPLVSVIDFSKAAPRSWGGQRKVQIWYGFYCVFLKDVKCGDLRYGRNAYDYQEGTLVFSRPGQIAELETDGMPYQPKGHGLVFHADLLPGTALAAGIQAYNFFGYRSNEALHLSERERQTVLDCLANIQAELRQPVDKHSKKLIISHIGLFLNYCERFYDRQFILRSHAHTGILEKFEQLLDRYFDSDKPQQLGLPSVAYCADALHLSANYFGDLIKKETGSPAKDYIQDKIIEQAKRRIFASGKSVNEIAAELGFKYPQHFSRMFKNKTGYTPNEFRPSN
jgi:AraC-like DNA-binding protein